MGGDLGNRSTAEVYAKAIERGAEVDRVAGAEIRAAMTRGCAPAIGVHRPFCTCNNPASTTRHAGK